MKKLIIDLDVDLILNALNRAFKADKIAIHSLICNRVPINFELVNDPYIVVDPSYVINNRFTLSPLGIINGLLIEAGSNEIISLIFNEDNECLGFGKIPFEGCENNGTEIIN